jgi:RNA polymerase sigma factor (sigma-70 family)
METNVTPDLAPRADGDLLRAFVDHADEAAFAELVARHGPLVLGACRRVLADAPDAEDAFQATFFILARKAKTVRRPERLGSWLYGVALRCAFRVRKVARRAKEQPMPAPPHPAAPPPADPHWADVRGILDAEIGRLPEKLRAALVLCELQGLDRAAAAARLGVPLGTLSSRLSRAKDALRKRLVRRGITLSLVALGLILSQAQTMAAVPPPLTATTVAGALRFAAGTGTGLPAAVAAHVLRAMREHRLAVGLAVGLLALGLIGLLLWGGRDWLWPKSDPERIQGHWEIVYFQHGLMKFGDGATMPATIDAERIRFGELALRYTLDPSQLPRAIDIDVPMDIDMQTGLGVYELTDDRLTIHAAFPGRPRPMSLQPANDAEAIVFVFERVKTE